MGHTATLFCVRSSLIFVALERCFEKPGVCGYWLALARVAKATTPTASKHTSALLNQQHRDLEILTGLITSYLFEFRKSIKPRLYAMRM